MSEKIIQIDGVGNVIVKHSTKSRYLNISIRPFVGIRASVPAGMSYNSAIRLITERTSWIRLHLDKMKEFEKLQTIFDENSGYCTKHHRLHLKMAKRKNISVRLSSGKINVVYPTELEINSKEVLFAIRKGIERALKIEAKEFLPGRVKKLAEQFNFKYNKLTLKNIKSRWGSCSRNNKINLSIHLMRLPEHLIDYVVQHELAHTDHHNHSASFWILLNEITGSAKKLDKELKKYRITIY